jgi:Tol biopolymer transport system component/DNA-binding winged helix-turn-helix (wHTH) protein
VQTKEKTTIYSFAEFKLIPSEKLFFRGDSPIHLRAKTFSLLLYLVESENRLCEKENLIKEIWGETIVEEGNLNRTISELRKTLGDNSAKPKFIETVPLVGYRFIAEVEKTVKSVEPVEVKELSNGNLQLAPKPPNFRNLIYAGIALLIFSVIALAIWKFSVGKEQVKSNKLGLIQLTSDALDENTPQWTTDGKIRYRLNKKDRITDWMKINADGTEQIKEDTQFSPDGSKIIITDSIEKASYIANADGSNKRKMPILLGNLDWSKVSNEIVAQYFPDGKREASDIVIINLDTLELKNITNSPTFEADPAFSPDAQQVLFTSTKDGNAEIYLMNRDGSNVRRLTNNPAWESFASFSPDGTQISYNSDRANEKNNVYILNLDGSGTETPLPTGDYGNYVGNGAWSLDGTKFVFSSDRNGNEDIFVMDAEINKPVSMMADNRADLNFPTVSRNGKSIIFLAQTDKDNFEIRSFDVETKRLKNIHKLSNETSLSLSADGQTIAFQSKIDGNTEICLIEIDGSNLRNISNNRGTDAAAKFSPDGKQIAFLSNRGEQGVLDIYLMNADGSNQKMIYSSGVLGTNSSLDWSADGASIYFSNDKESGRNGNFEIFKIATDGNKEVIRLTNRPRFGDEAPAVSPDGKRIVFQSTQKENSEIYLMKTDGTGLLRLTRNLADDKSPIWTTDGTKIYFSSNRNGKYEIFEALVGK